MNPPGFNRSNNSSLQGFSLVELLTVVVVISILASLLTPSIGSILSGRNLSRTLDVISNTAAVARQISMSKGSPVAFVIAESAHSTPDETQAVVLLVAPETSTGDWTPSGAWTKVPSTIQLDVFSRAGKKSFYAGGEGPVPLALPLKLDGKTVSTYNYIVFYPDGSVDAPAIGPALTFRRLNQADASSEYTLVVQSNSGRTKILQ